MDSSVDPPPSALTLIHEEGMYIESFSKFGVHHLNFLLAI